MFHWVVTVDTSHSRIRQLAKCLEAGVLEGGLFSLGDSHLNTVVFVKYCTFL